MPEESTHTQTKNAPPPNNLPTGKSLSRDEEKDTGEASGVEIRKLRTFEDDIKRYKEEHGGKLPEGVEEKRQDKKQGGRAEPSEGAGDQKAAPSDGQAKQAAPASPKPRDASNAPQVMRIQPAERAEHSKDFQAPPKPQSSGAPKPKERGAPPPPSPKKSATPAYAESSGEAAPAASRRKPPLPSRRPSQADDSLQLNKAYASRAALQEALGTKKAPPKPQAKQTEAAQTGREEGGKKPQGKEKLAALIKKAQSEREASEKGQPSAAPSKKEEPRAEIKQDKPKRLPPNKPGAPARGDHTPASAKSSGETIPDSARRQAATPEIRKAPPPKQEEAPASAESSGEAAPESAKEETSPLHTFKQDAAGKMRQGDESELSVRLAERRRRIRDGTEPAPEETESSPSHAASFAVVGAIVVLLAGGSWYLFASGILPPLSSFGVGTDPSAGEPRGGGRTPDRSINASGLSRSDLINSIHQTAAGVPGGKTVRIAITENESRATAASFLNMLNANPPARLTRALSPRLTVGIFGPANAAPYIVLTPNSFENAFAGMLAWEYRMPEAIGPFVASEGAEFENLPDNSPIDSPFTDQLIAGYNARVYRDSSGRARLIYAFVNNQKILITGSRAAFSRLAPMIE